MSIISKIEKEIHTRFSGDTRILAVFLLGSAASGTMRQDSDIDLGIMISPGKTFSSLDRATLASDLTYRLKRTVDLGEISSKNLVYAREALFKGKVIFQRDRDMVNLTRANLLGMYDTYNFERKEVLDAYRAR